MKALHEGLRLDTRSISVRPVEYSSEQWHSLQVRYIDQVFHGWWKVSDNFVRTMVCNPPPEPPIQLNILVAAGPTT